METVAVYGTLRQGGERGYVMPQDKFLGKCNTAPEFTMFNIGQFPALVHGGNTPIVVERYLADENLLKRLDGIEGVTQGLYKRHTTVIDGVECMLYVAGPWLHDAGLNEGRFPVIESGDWFNR